MSTLSGLAIIDQDVDPLNNNVAYILTKEELWMTSNLQSNPPTWTKVLTNTSFSANMTDVAFSRVRCRSTRTYVLGKAINSTSETWYAVCFYSTNGTDWNYSWVVEDIPEGSAPFHLEEDVPWQNPVRDDPNRGLTVIHNGVMCGGVMWGKRTSIIWPGVEIRYGTSKPVYSVTPEPVTTTMKIRVTGANLPSFGYNAVSCGITTKDWRPRVVWGMGGDYTTGTYLGGGVWYYEVNPPGGSSNWYLGITDAKGTWIMDCWEQFDFMAEIIEWNGYNLGEPAIAFDVGRHDPNKVYVSTSDKIYRSVDGGLHWDVYIDDHAANDIECHYAQANDDEITFWGTDGKLYRTNGGKVEGVYGGVADISPIKIPFRVASDPVNGFPIFVLEHQGGDVYKVRKSVDGVSWTDIATGVHRARSLKSYAVTTTQQRRYVYLSEGKIWYCSDEATFVDRTGNYPSFWTPCVINLY